MKYFVVSMLALTWGAFLSATAVAENEWFYNVTLTNGQSVDFYYPNVLPPHADHKQLDAFFAIFNPGDPALLEVAFDYLDNDGNTVIVPLAQSPLTILPRGTFPYTVGPVTLPFCPPQVSLHLKLIQGDFIEIQEGRFTHVCIPVPEPTAAGAVAVGAVGLAVACRRRSR